MAEQQDLTGTTTLHRREFRPALTKRYRRLKGHLRRAVGYHFNVLRLSRGDHVETSHVDALQIPRPPHQFRFETDGEARHAFMRWFRQAQAAGVLEEIPVERVRNGQHYTAVYVRSAYTKGLADATRRAREQGIDVDAVDIDRAFNLPVHRRLIADVYQRTYENLETVTQDSATAVRRTLTTGMAQGWNPNKMASALTDEVDDVGIVQARTLSRTEISNAYNTGSARRYEDFGVEFVDVITSNPCPICQSLEADNPYPIEDAYALIPARTHPNCVCTIAPRAQ